MIRMTTDRLGGTTYSFANLNAFLANTASTVQYLGDVSAPSVFNNGADRRCATLQQEYYVAYAQDEWRAEPELHAELRRALRLLLAAARERNNLHREVQHRHGRDRSEHDAGCSQSKKNNFQPRVSMHLSRSATRPSCAAASASSSAPARPRTRSSRVETDRISIDADRAARFPIDPAALRRELRQQPEQPVVPAARLRERVHDPRAHLSVHRLRSAGAAGHGSRPPPPTSAARAATCSCAA